MITGVILAAGASSRMGTHKLLLPIGGEPMVTRTVRQVAEAGFDDVLVVVGHQHEQVLAAIEGLRCRHAINPDYADGHGELVPDRGRRAWRQRRGDVRAGRSAVRHGVGVPAAARCIPDTASGQTQSPGIVSVRYGDVTAPPHLFDREFFPELAVLEHGARPVLQRHRDRTVVLQFPPELLLDVDTPEDYERAKARLSEGR